MAIQGALTESDYVAAQFLHMRPRLVFAVYGGLLLALTLWAAAEAGSAVLIGCLAILAAYFALLIPFLAKRNFRSYKALAESVTVEARVDGLFFRRLNGEGLLPWADIRKWRQNKRLVLVYPANNIFHMIPRRFFENDESFKQFTALLETRVGKST
jgi:hypothetical protein